MVLAAPRLVLARRYNNVANIIATPVDSRDSLVSDDHMCLLTIHSKSSGNKIIIHPVLNGKQVPMEVDTGATKTVTSEHNW